MQQMNRKERVRRDNGELEIEITKKKKQSGNQQSAVFVTEFFITEEKLKKKLTEKGGAPSPPPPNFVIGVVTPQITPFRTERKIVDFFFFENPTFPFAVPNGFFCPADVVGHDPRLGSWPTT